MVYKPKDAYDRISEGITKGVYRGVRLLEKKGKNYKAITAWPSTKRGDDTQEFLNFIFQKMSMQPGNYRVETKHYPGGATADVFEINYPRSAKPFTLSEKSQEESRANNSGPEQPLNYVQESIISADEYKELLNEMADLRMQNDRLAMELEIVNKYIIPQAEKNSLAQSGQRPWEKALDGLFKGLGDSMPDIVDTLLGYAEQKAQKSKQGPNPQQPQEPVPFERIVQHFRILMGSNLQEANRQLDQIKAQDPNLYAKLQDALGFTEESKNNNHDSEPGKTAN